LVDEANQQGDALLAESARSGRSHCELLGINFAASDIAYGIWPDAKQPNGVAVALLKGAGFMQVATQYPEGSNKKFAVNVFVTRCRSKAEAWAKAEEWGDDRDAASPVSKALPCMPATGGHLLSMDAFKQRMKA
jgi:hypothetical protein